MDQIGNIHGRVEGMNPSADALLIGSHSVMLHTHLSCNIVSILLFPFDLLTKV